MFTTTTVHWIQDLFGPAFYPFFEFISVFGNLLLTTLLVYLIISAVDLKKGMLIANIFFYTVIISFMLKESFDFPRPLGVDPGLMSFDFEVGPDLTALQPVGFFELPGQELLAEYRKGEVPGNGFPSGHVSIFSALLIAVFLVYGKSWMPITISVLIILMMISRVYLARHYLGDVLGGLALGLLLSTLVYYLHSKSQKGNLKFLVPLVFLIPLLPISELHAGSLIGINLAYIFMSTKFGEELKYQGIGKRALSFLIFFIPAILGMFLGNRFFSEMDGSVSVVLFSLIYFGTFSLSYFLMLKTRLAVSES